jgi:CPA2 family monovalent cation:H+ antiporter-2
MHNLSFLHDIIILLLASLIIVVIFKELRLSPALGYLVAGTAIGPFGFGIVSSISTTKSVAELGIVFMLFAIGLELTLSKLANMKKYVLGFGGLQVLLSSIIIFAICHFVLKLNGNASIVIGVALAMSSTAIVLQIIQEKAEQNSKIGKLAFSVLLMQDLAVIPILVLLPILAKNNNNLIPALSIAFGKAIIAMIIIFAFGRLCLRPIYRLIAKSHNDVLFLSFTLLIILGSAYISQLFDMSSALGAFIAGLMVAETEYRYRVEEEILSLKSLLLGLFFMSIGMFFDYDFLIKSWFYIAIASLSLILLKTTVIVVLSTIFKLPLAIAIKTGLLLSQGGEFAFVVFLIAVQQKFLSNDLSEFLMTTTTLTMALTPLLYSIGNKIRHNINTKQALENNKLKNEVGDISKHIIIIGFSKIGRIISYILEKKKVSYLILENNHSIIKKERENGYNIHYGDALNLDILNNIVIQKCEAVIIAIDDEIACLKISRFLNQHFPNITLITKTESLNKSERLKKIGANYVVVKNLETALYMSKLALIYSGINIDESQQEINYFRDFFNNEGHF